MNINKFTQKSIQAINDCEKLAYEYGHQEIDQEHLVYNLLAEQDSLLYRLFEKMDIAPEAVMNRIQGLLERRPKVSGGQLYMSQALNKALLQAEDEAKQMGDEYVSVEHLFLSLLKNANKEM